MKLYFHDGVVWPVWLAQLYQNLERTIMIETKRAVIFMDDENEGEIKLKKPLLLQSVLFCPMLTWLGNSLRESGVERFFVLCVKNYQEEARTCFASTDNVTISDSLGDLVAFLQGAEQTLVIPGAAVPVESSGKNEVYAVSGDNLARSLREQSNEVEGAESVRGFTTISSMKGLNSMQFLGRSKILRDLLNAGANVMDPNNTYIDPRVRVGAGTIILPNTILRGETVIGEDCEIGPDVMLTDCIVGDGVTINASQCEESEIHSGCTVGPYAHLRPRSVVGEDSKIGAFVQLKNCNLGKGTKMAHLTYVGDADVGEACNFGCGTVTCNYDGKNKFRTTIGDHAFIGCNTNLVAPVKVGDGAYTAAGSTITEDVPAGDLSIARARQVELPGWADQRRKDGRLK